MPSKMTEPDVARRTPVITFTSVVFPAPFGPIRPTISPRPRVNDTLSTARTPPNAFVNPRTSRIAFPVIAELAGSRPTETCGETKQPARQQEHEQHDDEAEHTAVDLEEARPDLLLEQLEGDDTDDRAEQRAGAPEQHHNRNLDGHEDAERVGRIDVRNPGGIDRAARPHE